MTLQMYMKSNKKAMKKELLKQLEDFEIFVERMEKFVERITEENKDEYMMVDFDLRTPQPFDTEFRLPNKLEDYFPMWELVQKAYERFKSDENAPDCFFFDLYWNDLNSSPKSAYYHDECFWVEFNDQKGIVYK